MRIFLSGPMGAGKSSVAVRVADRLGLAALDLDQEIESAGRSIDAIFREEGEAGFRARERDALARVLKERDDVVIALGGGTVCDEENRRGLVRSGILITLMAPTDVLLARVGAGEGRPLLQGDAAERLRRLLHARKDVYAECHATVSSEGPLEEVAARVVDAVADPGVLVRLGRRSYVVEIGEGVRARLADRLEGRGAALVADTNTAQWRDAVLPSRAVSITLPAGEENKTIETVTKIWDAALEGGLDRKGCVVAVGGGVVGDLTGFAAATLLRGVSFGQVPTSLLAMVDSSVGGKTGFNRSVGKNLVGAFHQPEFVLCDLDTLSTLPPRELVAGRAEIAKAAWIDGEAAVAALEEDAAALGAGDPRATADAIRRSVVLKARVVEDDEREAGRRRVLNLGHTIGHALEAMGAYRRWRHGEAVSLGLVAAARVGRRLGDLRAEDEARLVRLLDALSLPIDLDGVLRDEAFQYLQQDKKRDGDRIHFIVPGSPGSVRVTPLSIDEIRGAFAG
ncbi:MAG: 3-dehydroquinate synthase [Myxococcota bacterium]